MHVRGFAPFGAPEKAKLTTDECAEQQRSISAVMGEEFDCAMWWLQPYVRNHTVGIEILRPGLVGKGMGGQGQHALEGSRLQYSGQGGTPWGR